MKKKLSKLDDLLKTLKEAAEKNFPGAKVEVTLNYDLRKPHGKKTRKHSNNH